MAFSHLIEHLLDDPGVAEAIGVLEHRSIAVPDLSVSARAALAASAVSRHREPILIVASRGDRAETLASTIAEYVPDRTVATWPAPEALPYEQLPSISRRLPSVPRSLTNFPGRRAQLLALCLSLPLMGCYRSSCH
jgi:transcription-repair coupling factor (superfamily II helicase)